MGELALFSAPLLWLICPIITKLWASLFSPHIYLEEKISIFLHLILDVPRKASHRPGTQEMDIK